MMLISVPPVSVTGITLTSDMCALFVSAVRVPHALYLPFFFVHANQRRSNCTIAFQT